MLFALRIATLCAVYARSGRDERRGQRVELGDRSSRHQRQRAVTQGGELLQLLTYFFRDENGVRLRLNSGKSAVYVKKEGIKTAA